MRCIFCKTLSDGSHSVEHIIPESLGNIDHFLPKGLVCDDCNNYFARKIEKPILESPMMRLLRSDRKIPNKRKNIPSYKFNENPILPDYRLMSRFLSKAALETLVFKTLEIPNMNNEIVEKVELDYIRNYARFNRGEIWPFAFRTLYPVNAIFKEDLYYYEILHEFDLLYTGKMELFYVLAILGVEFVINLGNRDLEGYTDWLDQHNGVSPLYK